MQSNHAALWRVIYIARGEEQARRIEDMLRQAGFMIDEKRPDAQGPRTGDVEIRALESEAEEARLFLMEQGL